MKALVVYESMFGATQSAAEAIGEGLDPHASVRVVEVGTLVEESGGAVDSDVDLLVVGGPTHAFSMSRASTRRDARKEGLPIISTGVGVREWLDGARVPGGVACAAFDTKVATPRLPGAASSGITKRLRKLGGRAAAKAESFAVQGTAGGLLEGELERARAWGDQVGRAAGT
jgi:hypothetical protein